MSTDAVNWAMDDAPMLRTEKGKPDTTARHVLQALAEHARPDGTNSCPSVLRIQYRTGYDRTTVQRALRRLEKGELIARDGVTDGRTRWKLAMHLRRPESDWSDLEREEDDFRAAAAERKRRSRSKGVTHSESVTVTDGEGVTVTDAESVTADVTDSTPSRHALKVRSSRTERRPNHQQPSDNQLLKDSSSPAAQADEPSEQQHLEAFGAFWSVYPKKRAREEAKKAWIAAIKRGADPQHMADRAKAYAHERHGQDPKYTKYPATWLNKGCYDDEPDPQPTPGERPQLRAVSGGWQPWKNPTNQDDYEQSFFD
ncbi:helix-turn-helix domain-containing protein [Streptomyces caniscabiei]|uniref:helix-turn-helix domain-containing protein n=1 Tax=Streptomyces caniscabiei TaxID=2746961 RepID=UPI0029AE55FC|nr:helix-turn-helix domain-containing protein [Streptomyces caniscabiei]MDX3516252.1 helix-turn-helix domain-containing protein [Streptomyces caniscabiei]MDX3725263.1 helix-turn-helix domain-containing protein [Streptomyces caniscabiei]